MVNWRRMVESLDAQPEAAAGNANGNADDADDADSKLKRENDKKNRAYNMCVPLRPSSTPTNILSGR